MPFRMEVGSRPVPTRARAITAATAALRRGELVVLPVESSYGLAADAFSTTGIDALRAAKGSGAATPLTVLIGAHRTADGLASGISTAARDLMQAFWPGPLTLILREQPTLAWDLGGGYGVISLRMPLHPVALDLLAASGPLAVTGANRAGSSVPRDCDQAEAQFGDEVTVYLDAGPSPEGMPSSVVDVSGDVPVLLREGAISLDSLRRACPELEAPDGPAVRRDGPAPQGP